MDAHLWFDLRVLYDAADGAIYVHYLRKIAQAHDKVLRNQMGSLAGIDNRPAFLFTGADHVAVAQSPGQANVVNQGTGLQARQAHTGKARPFSI